MKNLTTFFILIFVLCFFKTEASCREAESSNKITNKKLVLTLSAIEGQENFKTNNLPIIDMHLHVYNSNNYWGGNNVQFRDTLLNSPSSHSEHLEAVIKQMQKYNIVKAYASGSFKALGLINNAYPDFFIPSLEIWPTRELLSDNEYLRTVEKRILNGEIKAIGEVLNFYTGIAPNDPVMDTLYRIAEKYNLPIGLHFAMGPPGAQLNEWPDMKLEYANPYLLQDVLKKFPKLKIFMMHAGLPFEDEIFTMFFMFPNLYVDISPWCWGSDYGKEILDHFLKKAVLYGYTNRLMFGTDALTWPEAIGVSVEYINNAEFLSEKQKRDILYNNAARFLNLSDDEIFKHKNADRMADEN